jgi:hypothetical protein
MSDDPSSAVIADPPRVRQARPSEWKTVAETLREAMAKDPFFLWLVRQGVMADPLAYFLGLVDDAIRQGDRIDTTDTNESVAIWMPPRARVIPSTMPGQVKRVLHEIDAAAPKPDHRFLAWICTREGAQGKKLGSSVLAYGLKRVDKKHRASALWTANPRSRLFFERFDFRVIHELNPEDAPRSWWLWRDPT